MATPPRTIEKLPPQRAGELPALERALERASDYLVLARVYATPPDDRPADAARILELARTEVAAVLEELNSFRAPAATAKRGAPELRTVGTERTNDGLPRHLEGDGVAIEIGDLREVRP